MSIQTYKLPDNLETEIQELDSYVQKFKKGDVSLTEFKVVRVPFGIYEQRKKDTYMVRIRNAGSVVTPDQLKAIAEISQRHAAGYIHLTTRQEIQLHYVLIDSIVPVVRELKAAGLASRGGGGNTVRNIIAQVDSGIAKDDVFDVSGYAIALTERFVAEPDSWNLPRKFKIAFSSSADDRGYATIHDVGYIAKIKDGQKGFAVYFAGGLGAKTQVGLKLFDFIPEKEVYNIAKAVKTVFYKNGNRKNKHAARLRFLVKTLGEEELKRKFFEEYEAVKKANYPPLNVQTIDDAGVDPKLELEQIDDTKDYELWLQRFVSEQRQEGLRSIIIPAHLGHVDNDNAIALAEFLMPFGNNVIRVRRDQNFLVRNIQEKYLPNFYAFLKKTFNNFNRPLIIDKTIACAGASTCQLGICLSPGAATGLQQNLTNSTKNLDLDAVSDAVINISGCPNSCGQHHVADIGFFGKVSRLGDNVYPSFNVVTGGIVKEGETELAERIGAIASRDLPSFVHDAFETYISKKSKHTAFKQYVRSEEGKTDLTELCKKYSNIPSLEENKNYYFDWGTDKIFSVAERGKGECSAGIFDLIESDLGHIQQARKVVEDIIEQGDSPAQKRQYLKDMVFYSSRVLLVSRALQPKSEEDAYNYFREHFINTGLVDAKFDKILKLAEENDFEGLLKNEPLVFELASRMQLLYDVMDPAFQFKLPEGDSIITGQHVDYTVHAQTEEPTAAASSTNGTATAASANLIKDFRGVACPMNFVKTKMELAKLKQKDLLQILLDDGEPIDNVPGSVRAEGHKILKQEKIDNYWTVLIEKG